MRRARRARADPRRARSSSAAASCASQVEMRLEDGTLVCCGHALRHGGAAMSAPRGRHRARRDRAERRRRRRVRARAARRAARACAPTRRCASSASAARSPACPQGVDELASRAFDEDELLAMNSSHRFARLAALEAWQDAGLARPAARRRRGRLGHRRGPRHRHRRHGHDRRARRAAHRRGQGAPPRQHRRRAGDGERHLGARRRACWRSATR